MSEKDIEFDRRSDTEQTPLLLDGVSRDDLTKGFLREIHEAADDEEVPLENISIATR
ncbi:hypothetical protein [Halorussus caseinilyticus]|uniref:Uncharacterized protein n=1 Tax=Halorussus caseinilyticus TaxID=3034025 RepID=A0ABD5WJ23_9EURY